MPNANTVRQQVSGTIQLTTAPLSGTTITTTETAFALNNNALTGTGGGVIPLSAGVTGLYKGTGRVLHVAATGTVTGATGASTTLILKLYQVSAALIAAGLTSAIVVASGNALGTSSTRTIAQTACAFSFDSRIQLDSAGNLHSQFTDEIDNQIDVYTAGPAVVTGVAEADLNFVLTAKLGGTEVGVVLNLNEFRIDLE